MRRDNLTYVPTDRRSRASLVALKDSYPQEWQVWLDFRMKVLTTEEDVYGTLKCHYCGKEDLHKVTEGVPRPLQATLDHVQPLARGGAKYDVDNLVVACQPCNQKKGGD